MLSDDVSLRKQAIINLHSCCIQSVRGLGVKVKNDTKPETFADDI